MGSGVLTLLNELSSNVNCSGIGRGDPHFGTTDTPVAIMNVLYKMCNFVTVKPSKRLN